ncbi:acyltransferase family protein [Paraburkholderia sp. A1RI-2L]|uniref:acyltransferase family protein n=1 Tax=unclassified Paraburkholderia TaxID=2615204 RepID=UPI003B7F0D08
MHRTNRSLEGLRGAAALLVVLFHLGQVSHVPGVIRNGYLAVDLFFVLSGFVICSAYGERLESGYDVWRFVVRRFGRLWPLHISTAVLYYVIGGLPLILTHSGVFAPTGAEALSIVTMTQGLSIVIHSFGNPNAWSTSDEFYVYLLFAAISLVARRHVQIAFAFAFAAIGLAIAIFVDAGTCVSNRHCMDLASNFGWARCICGFFIGVLIAFSRERLRSPCTPKIQVAVAICAPALMMGAYAIPLLAFTAPLVFGTLIAALISDNGPLATLLQARPMQYLGRTSYAMYLSHAVFVMPLTEWLLHGNYRIGYQLTGAVAFLFASLTLTHFMHKYVEIPFRDRIYAWADSRTHENAAPLLRNCSDDYGRSIEN